MLLPWLDRAQNYLAERLGEEAIGKVKGGGVRNGRLDWEEEEGPETSHTGRSSSRVKRRSQEQNVVEQVTLDDSEPVSTSSVLAQKIRICWQACTDMHCQSNAQILPFRDGWEKENY